MLSVQSVTPPSFTQEPFGVRPLLSVNEPRDHVASLTTSFPIDCNALRDLRDEVCAYWASRDMVLRGSWFRE
jgi:hypothetical protein